MKAAVVLFMALLVFAFPAMAEVVIDGTATPGEWSEADVVKLENGGEAMLLPSDDSLQIAHYWPSTLADATLEEQLIFGTTPAQLVFDPAQWQPQELAR